MRRELEHNLEAYGNVIKDESLDDSKIGQLPYLEALLGEAADVRGTSVEAQERIFEIQKKKQAIMQRLEADIRNLENPDIVPERKVGDRRIVCDGGKYFWRGVKEGKPNIEVSLGDIMTDGEWGALYYLDPQSVPRSVRKRYLIECAKRELENLLDIQIVIDETASRDTHWMKKEAYKNWEAERDSAREGKVAERMAKNFLKKLSYDENASYEIKSADVYRDVEKKIDFIAQRKLYVRGVSVSESDGVREKGFQFTLQTDRGILEHKREQVERSRGRLTKQDRVQDIVLVNVPSERQFSKLFEEWKEKQPCGGPERWLTLDVKKAFIENILQGMVPEEEIKKLVAAAEAGDPYKAVPKAA